jgi:hypothetical protein
MSDYEHLIYEQRGPVLDRKNLRLSFDTKVIGPRCWLNTLHPR